MLGFPRGQGLGARYFSGNVAGPGFPSWPRARGTLPTWKPRSFVSNGDKRPRADRLPASSALSALPDRPRGGRVQALPAPIAPVPVRSPVADQHPHGVGVNFLAIFRAGTACPFRVNFHGFWVGGVSTRMHVGSRPRGERVAVPAVDRRRHAGQQSEGLDLVDVFQDLHQRRPCPRPSTPIDSPAAR